MTIERLENYRTIKRQLKMHQKNEDISFISGNDTTKASIQNNNISNTTADIALLMCERITEKEYKELCSEFQLLHRYIYDITDLTVREIAKLKFISGYTYEQIAEATGCDATSVSRKLQKYIKNI